MRNPLIRRRRTDHLTTGDLDPAALDRDRLVAICLDLADRLRDVDPALWSRLHRQLEDVGVVAVVPDGMPVDDAEVDVVGREDTDAADRDGLVARTEFCGYRDRGRLVRRPQVVVARVVSLPVEVPADEP